MTVLLVCAANPRLVGGQLIGSHHHLHRQNMTTSIIGETTQQSATLNWTWALFFRAIKSQQKAGHDMTCLQDHNHRLNPPTSRKFCNKLMTISYPSLKHIISS